MLLWHLDMIYFEYLTMICNGDCDVIWIGHPAVNSLLEMEYIVPKLPWLCFYILEGVT